jgi:hypothetical protein
MVEILNKYNVIYHSEDDIIIQMDNIGEIKILISRDYPFKKPRIFVNQQKYEAFNC